MQQPTPPLEPGDSQNSARKRVCKACDRCRLKKSKCDGSSPCSRCKADNAICIFGERKKSHDKVYPKGYVEMLEQQQAQLVTGLQELYRRTQRGQGWEGKPLADTSGGYPLTHDILARLGALKGDAETSRGVFEEDLRRMQRELFENGATAIQRGEEESEDSASEDSQPYFNDVSDNTPMFDAPAFGFNQAMPTPPSPSDITPRPPTSRSEGYFSGQDILQQYQQARTPALETIFSSSIQSQSLPASATVPNYDMSFYDQYTASTSTDAFSSTLNRHSMHGSSDGPCLVPEFMEDDDFSAFVNRTT